MILHKIHFISVRETLFKRLIYFYSNLYQHTTGQCVQTVQIPTESLVEFKNQT